MPDLRMVEGVRVMVANNGWANEQRKSKKHHAMEFPEWYLDEIQRLNKKYRPIRWIPLDVPKLEVDMEQFLSIWDKENIDIVRTASDAAEPWDKDAHPLGKKSNWHNPQFKGLDFYSWKKENFAESRDLAWTAKFYEHPFFDRITEFVLDTLPFHSISHLYIWESVRDVMPHRDAEYFWDLPNMFRIMLNDENDKPTLYTCDVDDGDLHYIELPDDTNTFVWSNGSQIHGSDYHGKRKQIVCINGIFHPKKYEDLLDRSITKYKDKLNYELKM
jgi:hypothetical protein